MAKLKLDDTTLNLDSAFEQIMRRTLSGSKTFEVKEGEPLPSVPSFPSEKFTTMSLTTDDGAPIPVVNQYDTIVEFATNYREKDKIFSYSITLAKDE